MPASGWPLETSKPFIWLHSIDNNSVIKAETNCLICSEQFDNAGRCILKMYRHRGLANFLREKTLVFRVQREFRILRHLNLGGIPCSIPHFWTYGYCEAQGFYEILCTRQIPNTKSWTDFLALRQAADQEVELGPLFHLVRKMHQSGVYHGALSTKNILAADTGHARTYFYLIDLARGWLFKGSVYGKKIAWYDLLKLVKSIDSDLGVGFCRPYLACYGYGKRAVEKFYRDAGRYKSFSRKQKRIKNTLKVKVFILAILTRLTTRASIDE